MTDQGIPQSVSIQETDQGHLPPLVVTVNIPDNSLNKDLVLIHGYKQKKRFINKLHQKVLIKHSQRTIYLPMMAPRVNGLSFVNMMELVGRFPSKTFQNKNYTVI